MLHETNYDDGYISHANLRRFLINFVDGKLNIRLPYSNPVFAEPSDHFLTKVKHPEFERHRIAVLLQRI